MGGGQVAAWLGALLLGSLPVLPMGGAQAQELPGRFHVSGVAADDVLNVRAGPAASAPVVGGFGPGRRDVEVIALSPDRRWGLVGLPEGNGWVAMRYLAADPLPSGRLPRPLRCLGTEPFWSVTVTDQGAVHADPGATIALVADAEGGFAGGWSAVFHDGAGGAWLLALRRADCSDGMSDRRYGLAAVILRAGASDEEVLHGCCTLDGG
ncbi:MAG: peptide-binding protein [Rubellimicrobium sp.]|nr:peptide-binding protein [Rubellimicrobium sp.]